MKAIQIGNRVEIYNDTVRTVDAVCKDVGILS